VSTSSCERSLELWNVRKCGCRCNGCINRRDVLIIISLRLLDAVRRVIYALGFSVGEVVLVEQSRPKLLWPVDIILGAGGNAVLFGPWRAFALATVSASATASSSASSWGRWRPRCGSSPPSASAAPPPSPRWSKGAALLRRSSGEES
jgi:hypothetical protein